MAITASVELTAMVGRGQHSVIHSKLIEVLKATLSVTKPDIIHQKATKLKVDTAVAVSASNVTRIGLSCAVARLDSVLLAQLYCCS